MSFSIVNNASQAVITGIETLSSAYGSFTVTGGTFPLVSGGTVGGTNTEINDQKGSPQGTFQIFFVSGAGTIQYKVNGTTISDVPYSSGIAQITGPILKSTDTILITVNPL